MSMNLRSLIPLPLSSLWVLLAILSHPLQIGYYGPYLRLFEAYGAASHVGHGAYPVSASDCSEARHHVGRRLDERFVEIAFSVSSLAVIARVLYPLLRYDGGPVEERRPARGSRVA